MLTDLSFLEVGEPWPPEDPDTQRRLELYAKNRQLFDSRAEEVYGRWVEVLRENLEETHYVLNFHQRLSWLWADLIMGEPPKYVCGEPESDEQKALTALVEENGLNTTGQEVIVDTSRYGDGLFRLRLEEGRVVVEGQSPEYWFPVVSESNVRRVLYHVLAWTIERSEATTLVERATGAPAEKTIRYLQVEIHTAGQVEHRLYRLNGEGRIEERVANPAGVVEGFAGLGENGIETTGLDVPLVVHAPGARTTERLHGYDDYTKIDSSMEYLMWLAAQRQVILHKHSDPSIAGPELEDELQTESGQRLHKSGSRYYQIDPESKVFPQYLTWEGNLEASFRQTEELWRDVYVASETSPTAFGHSETGYAESGTSLRLRMMASLKKAERMRQRLDPVMKRLIKAAGELAGRDFSALSITWRDGLPADEAEASTISATDIASGITSRKSEMKRRYDYSDKQADEELEQIEEERRRENETATAGLGLGTPGMPA